MYVLFELRIWIYKQISFYFPLYQTQIKKTNDFIS